MNSSSTFGIGGFRAVLLALLIATPALADTTLVSQLNNGTVFTTTVSSSGESSSSVAIQTSNTTFVFRFGPAGESSTTVVIRPRCQIQTLDVEE